MDDLLSAFAGLGTSSNEELVAKFAQIMQTDTNTATFFLEASNWNVELALNSYLSSVGGSGGGAQQQIASIQAVPKGSCQVLDPSGALQAQLLPNQPFQLVWNLMNSGSKPWPRNVVLLHTEGPTLGAPKTAHLGGGVEPNRVLSQTMQLRAPSSPGQFASTWRLKYDGGYFGEAIWIITNVVAPPSGGSSPYSASGTPAAALQSGQGQQPGVGSVPGVDTAMQQMLIGMMGSNGGTGAAPPASTQGGAGAGTFSSAAAAAPSLAAATGMMSLGSPQQNDDDMMDDDL